MWKSVCCAVRGRGHETKDIPCQDKVWPEGKQSGAVSVIALADGAGSAKFSHLGAECVVKSISNLVKTQFDKFISSQDATAVRKEIIQQLRQDLGKTAAEHECSLNDLASTMLVAAADDKHYLLIHIGDGVIGYLGNSGLNVATKPVNG